MMRLFVSLGVLSLAVGLTVSGCRTTTRDGDETNQYSGDVRATSLGTRNMTLADGEVYLGAQPTRADLAAGARYPGIETVLDLRRESEDRGFDESEILDDLDVTYENVPMGGPDELSDEVLDESLRVIETAKRPLVVHCASGNRVGAVWMAWRMLEDGYSEERAVAEARQVGLRSDEFIPVVLDYVQRRRAESPKR